MPSPAAPLTLQPVKYDRESPTKSVKVDEHSPDAFVKYQSIALKNPFETDPSFRETLAKKEAYLPRNDSFPRNGQKVHDTVSNDKTHRMGMTKSFSDTEFLRSDNVRRARDRNPQRNPVTVVTNLGSPGQKRTSASQVQQENMTIRTADAFPDLDDVEKPQHSPFRKLFGERGVLGRSPSSSELPDPRYVRKGADKWSAKIKRIAEDVSEKVQGHLAALEGNSPPKQTKPATSGPAISLSPYTQGLLYMELELLLNTEMNGFLAAQTARGRISPESVRKTYEKWHSKGRPKVLGFRFDLATQRDLLLLNLNNVRLSGVNAQTTATLYGLLAAWKTLAKDISVRTFCHPDSAVRKHLVDAERVLDLIDAGEEGLCAFRELRQRSLAEMEMEERREKELQMLNGVERSWTLPEEVKRLMLD